ncbi:MAG: UvrD-helicase domain-containing protein [Patescibacteria group bacterium]|nr:UvrD-helicase domain-containing protein [Patescibacteria group bacterium]
MAKDLLDGLNCYQKEAVFFTEKPSLILAGAGSGKTRVLAAKVVYLIRKKRVQPKNILMITFTNKAAEEMKRRISEFQLGFVGTFHSFSARILRADGFSVNLRRNFLIYDESDQLEIIKSVLEELNLSKIISPAYLLNRISTAKNKFIPPSKYLDYFNDLQALNTAMIYNRYQQALERNNAVDFDDLITKTIQLFLKEKKVLEKYQKLYKYVLVDEFQDTNLSQYWLTKLLAEKNRKITVVGDFSQSIYSWRGAEIENLKRFERDFPERKVFFLKKNYRSTKTILNFAFQVISKNQTHPILELETDNPKGEEIIFYQAENEEEEGFFIADTVIELSQTYPFEQMAVLYRTNAQSRLVEEVFLHRKIPYLLIGGVRFYERKEIKDILAYLRLLINPKDEISFERAKKIGKKRLAKFQKYLKNNEEVIKKKATIDIIDDILKLTDYLSLFDPYDPEDYSRLENIKELKSVAISFPYLIDFLEQVSLVESEYFEKEKNQINKVGVRLMTIHQAKGLEFSIVFIPGVEEGLLPHIKSLDDDLAIEEERRLFYVAITRAKERLFISYTKKRFIFGAISFSSKSRFLD